MAELQAKILSPAEEKSLDKVIDDLKDMRDGKELSQGVNFEVKDKAGIDKKISDMERIRQNNSLPKLDERDMERVRKEYKLLEDDLQRGMPTWDQYERMRPQHGAPYVSLVRQIVKWNEDPIRRQKVARWKVLRRLLNPDDPRASDTMYLFPQ